MSRREIAVIVFVLFAAALAAAVWVFVAKKQSPSGIPARGSPSAAEGTQSGPVTRAPAPANVVVPEKGASVAANVAPPETVGAAAPGSSASYRSYSIEIQSNRFVPDTVIVREGDIARIKVTAVGSDYDFVQPDYGVSAAIPQGQTKTIQFGATASGKFTFYCSKCGGPEKGPIGYIVVAPK